MFLFQETPFNQQDLESCTKLKNQHYKKIWQGVGASVSFYFFPSHSIELMIYKRDNQCIIKYRANLF